VNLVVIILCLLAVSGCTRQEELALPEEIPLIPVRQVTSTGGIAPLRAPLRVHDPTYPLVHWTAEGERVYDTYDLVLFPTDLIVVFTEGMATPVVFLARSPHGGCLVQWNAERDEFVDPCYGSHFARAGEQVQGPAQRGLDRLPAEVRGEMIWVRGEMITGEPVE
jgi:nitrite reductase/ring-hydroxylating ferredoxin subunit